MTSAPVKTPWKISGEEVATCNCAWGCPCQFNALPTHGQCEALVACRIRSGHYGKTKLDGVIFAAAYWWPGPIHEGNGVVQLAIDRMATEDQRAAMLRITSGEEGGALFEIFASVITKALDPIYPPIEFEADRQKRVARLNAPGLGEFRAEPIKNPVTGEEHRAQIRLPGGFEYKEAEMGNAVHLRATLGDKTIENRNTYAQFCEVEWSNT